MSYARPPGNVGDITPKLDPGKWHKVSPQNPSRTIMPCHIRIRRWWHTQAEDPPSGEPACKRCFGPKGVTP